MLCLTSLTSFNREAAPPCEALASAMLVKESKHKMLPLWVPKGVDMLEADVSKVKELCKPLPSREKGEPFKDLSSLR